MSTPAELEVRRGAERSYRLVTGGRSAPRPAAGAEAVVTIPGGALWRILAVRFELVTSAVVANRFADIILDDGTTEFWRITLAPAQTASQTRQYFLAPNVGFEDSVFSGTAIYWPLPEGPYPGGFRIRTATVGIDAGDQWSTPALYVLEVGVRGLASQLAYELRNIITEDEQLTSFEQRGF